MSRRAIPVIALAVVLGGFPSFAAASDTNDLDAWHEKLLEDLGEEPQETGDRRPALGIYPNLGGAIGPPNWVAAQGSVYLSFTDGKRFSIYGGYGIEKGPRADSSIVTLGWGGVRSIPVASKQTGFHGKYLRYRRWEEDDHGIHHGLSVGTESGVGFGALAFELGAARSDRNHWLLTAHIALKLAAPIRIPLTRGKAPPPADH